MRTLRAVCAPFTPVFIDAVALPFPLLFKPAYVPLTPALTPPPIALPIPLKAPL